MAASTSRRALREQGRGLRASVGVIVTFRHELLARWPLLLGALGCALAFAAARLLEPWPLKYIFDNVLASQPFHSPIPGLDGLLADDRGRILVAATLAILVLAALRGFFYAYETLFATRIGQEVVLSLRRKLFAQLQRHSLDFHAENSTGDLLTRLTGDVALLRELLVGALLGIISEGLVLIGFLVVMFIMEWRLAVIAIVAMPLVFGLVTAYSGRIRAATRKQRASEGEIAGRLEEVLSGIHIVQLFAREDEENDRLRRLNKRSLRSGLRSARLESDLNRWVELSIALTTAITLWFGAMQVIAGHMTAGDLIVFVAYMQSFYRPLKRISRVARRAAKAGVSVERIMDVLEREPDLRDGTSVAPRFRGRLQLEDVSFAYARSGGRVLHDIDLTVEAGTTIALVGPTGAGKSTLLGLIPRLRDPSAGVVRIDGQDVRELTLKSLRDQISVVPQDGMLFGGTVRENIAYGKPDASDAEIEAAARAALIHDFVVSLPDGYDTELAERGVTLSGGQRQRLAIARAIVKDAPIVLLDEPTTGLDAESEHLVVTALARLLEGRTALVIAHRLSTIRSADTIVVLDEGRIVERGGHEELSAAGGLYSRLHTLQTNPHAASPALPVAGVLAVAPPAVMTTDVPAAPDAAPTRTKRRRATGLAARLATRLLALVVVTGALGAAAALRPNWPEAALAVRDAERHAAGVASLGEPDASPRRARRVQLTASAAPGASRPEATGIGAPAVTTASSTIDHAVAVSDAPRAAAPKTAKQDDAASDRPARPTRTTALRPPRMPPAAPSADPADGEPTVGGKGNDGSATATNSGEEISASSSSGSSGSGSGDDDRDGDDRDDDDREEDDRSGGEGGHK